MEGVCVHISSGQPSTGTSVFGPVTLKGPLNLLLGRHPGMTALFSLCSAWSLKTLSSFQPLGCTTGIKGEYQTQREKWATPLGTDDLKHYLTNYSESCYCHHHLKIEEEEHFLS